MKHSIPLYYLIFYAMFICTIHSVYGNNLDECFTNSEMFQRAHIGICIVDLETEEIIYARNSEQFFVPASLQKIALSVAALSSLGKDYAFYTDLSYEGTVDAQGVLKGNVWIKGGGDPTLDLSIFNEWHECLKKAGINSIKGKIIVDASFFEKAMASPFWLFEDLGNYFGAGVSSLNIHKNLYHITFKPGQKEGDLTTVVKIDPPIPYLIFHNEVRTGPPGSGDQAYVFGSEYSFTQFYRGTIPIDQEMFTIKAAMPDPALFCAMTLAQKVDASEGAEVVRDKINASLTPLYHKKSPSLTKILEDLNCYSINLYAEDLLKAIGIGSRSQGICHMQACLKQLDIPIHVKDGCGLARGNLITPQGFVKLLCLIRKDPLYQPIYASFPYIGQGTLKLFPPIAKASLKAKDGSMSMIANLGGFLKLESGKEFAFCICCNNFPGSKARVMAEAHKLLTTLSNLQ